MTRRRQGAVLLEVLLSLALFVGAATFTLGVTRTILTSLDRAERDALAADLASSLMNELEAGLVNLATLREAGDGLSEIGSGWPLDDGSGPRWRVEVETERSAITPLTLVTITVEATEDAASSFTVRSLVRLRARADDEAFELDEIMQDLPEASEP